MTLPLPCLMFRTLIYENLECAYLKTLGMHVYLTTTKKSYLGNNKHIEVNAQAIMALRQTLSKEYLSMISHYDSAFTMWNTLTSRKLQIPKICGGGI